MAVNGGHAGTKKGPNWGHVKECPDFASTESEYVTILAEIITK